MKRKISSNEILNLYDKFAERLSVISYSKTFNHEKIMELQNVNIFEAFKELTMRVTPETYAIVTIDLPSEVNTNDYKEVKKYQLSIDEYYFGTKNLKNN